MMQNQSETQFFTFIMKRYSLLLAVSLLLLPISDLFGQIVINRQAFESARGKTMTQSSFDITGEAVPVETIESIIAISGPNRTFDFSNISFPADSAVVTRSYVLNQGEAHPFSDDNRVATANYITRVEFLSDVGLEGLIYSYAILSDDSLTTVAVGFIDLETDEKELETFEDFSFSLSEPLPQQYQSQWTDVWAIDIAGFVLTTTEYYHIDSWGTLRVPGGKTASALRMKVDTEVTSNLQLPGFGQERRPESYNYISMDGITASISLEYDDESGEVVNYLVMYSTTGSTQTSIGRDRVDLPDGFALAQNYPNPFNPTTTIDFSLPFTADATIKVYDMTGRVVSTINMPGTTAGTHSVQFDAANLSSGVYLYRLEAGGYVTSKMLTLVK